MVAKQTLLATLRHLYEGAANPLGVGLCDNVTFRDPAVVVHGRPKVLNMFRRLNALFPYSEIQHLDTLDSKSDAYDLLVNYRRAPNSAAHPFRTHLHVSYQDGLIRDLTEHWQSPLRFSAEPRSPITEMVRGALGQLISSNAYRGAR